MAYKFQCPDHPGNMEMGDGPAPAQAPTCTAVVDVICHTHGDVHFDPNDEAAVKKHVTDGNCNTEPIYCNKKMQRVS